MIITLVFYAIKYYSVPKSNIIDVCKNSILCLVIVLKDSILITVYYWCRMLHNIINKSHSNIVNKDITMTLNFCN